MITIDTEALTFTLDGVTYPHTELERLRNEVRDAERGLRDAVYERAAAEAEATRPRGFTLDALVEALDAVHRGGEKRRSVNGLAIYSNYLEHQKRKDGLVVFDMPTRRVGHVYPWPGDRMTPEEHELIEEAASIVAERHGEHFRSWASYSGRSVQFNRNHAWMEGKA